MTWSLLFADPGGMMINTLKVRDTIGEITISFEEMCKYHGKDFLGGVALSFKVLQMAFSKLMGDKAPERSKIRLVLGFSPPGVLDALEYATRAISQHRIIIDPTIGIGPKSTSGNYYFEIHYEKKKITMWLKEGLLPDDFFGLAQKGLAGAADPDELKRWHGYKTQLGTIIMNKDPEEVLEIGEIRLA
jgi:hypothetical protein